MHELRPVTGRGFFDTIQESIEDAILWMRRWIVWCC